jgi:hypothetical protein
MGEIMLWDDIKLIAFMVAAALVRVYMEYLKEGWHPWRSVASFFIACFCAFAATEFLVDYFNFDSNGAAYLLCAAVAIFGQSFLKLAFGLFEDKEALVKLIKTWRGQNG